MAAAGMVRDRRRRWRKRSLRWCFQKLRETQKLVKENHDVNLEQANMFRDLRKILALKLKVLRTEVAGESGVAGATNHLIMD